MTGSARTVKTLKGRIDSTLKTTESTHRGVAMKTNVGLKQFLPKFNCYRALVVDGSLPSAHLVRENLTKIPQIGEIEYAGSGENALKRILLRRYDLIFLAIDLPGLDGFETCRRMREIKGYEITPIVLFSDEGESEHKFSSFINGGSAYVSKPIQFESFRSLNFRMISLLEDMKAIY